MRGRSFVFQDSAAAFRGRPPPTPRPGRVGIHDSIVDGRQPRVRPIRASGGGRWAEPSAPVVIPRRSATSAYDMNRSGVVTLPPRPSGDHAEHRSGEREGRRHPHSTRRRHASGDATQCEPDPSQYLIHDAGGYPRGGVPANSSSRNPSPLPLPLVMVFAVLDDDDHHRRDPAEEAPDLGEGL